MTDPAVALGPEGPFDPSKLEFCRASYDFEGSDPNIELSVKKGDIVAILSKTDPFGNASQWWRGRLRDGRTGYFPSNYCEIIERRRQITELDESGSGKATPKGASTPKNAFDVAEFQEQQKSWNIKG
jgi:peroxin-13